MHYAGYLRLLSEIRLLKTENNRLNESLKRFIEKDHDSKTIENEMVLYIKHIDSLFNRIVLNSSKFLREETRIVTEQGKIVTYNGKTVTAKVKVNNYNYTVSNLYFKINLFSDSNKQDPILDIQVFFDLIRNEKNFSETLNGELIYITLLTPNGYFTKNKTEQNLEIMPFKINTKNQFSFAIPKSTLVQGEYKFNFIIDSKEIGEGIITIK